MTKLFLLGNSWFMGAVTLVAVSMLVVTIISIRAILMKPVEKVLNRNIRLIRELGLLALIVGILCSTIDMIAAFGAIKMAGDISMSLMAAGLQITIVCPAYGLIIYMLAILISMGLRWKVSETLVDQI